MVRKPYFVKRLKCWYVRDANAREIRLDTEKDKAFDAWHELQAAGVSEGEFATVQGLIDAFFDDIDGTISQPRLDALIYYASCFAIDLSQALLSSQAVQLSQSCQRCDVLVSIQRFASYVSLIVIPCCSLISFLF